MPELRIYFEGHQTLRQGFRKFFKQIYDQARARQWRVSLVAAKGTPANDFAIALRTHRDAWNILLLDSDGELTDSLLIKKRLDASQRDAVFWMVQMMEAWFYADENALENYYGNGFNQGAMSGNPEVEQIGKKDLEDGLKAATKNTSKGVYHKTKHAPDLLERIKPDLVRAAAPNCKRLFDTVLAKLG